MSLRFLPSATSRKAASLCLKTFGFLVDRSEAAEIGEIMSQYGLEPHEYGPVVDGLRRNPQAWLDFMMR